MMTTNSIAIAGTTEHRWPETVGVLVVLGFLSAVQFSIAAA